MVSVWLFCRQCSTAQPFEAMADCVEGVGSQQPRTAEYVVIILKNAALKLVSQFLALQDRGVRWPISDVGRALYGSNIGPR